MPQNDLDIANQSFPATRAELNSALVALGTMQSGTTAPASPSKGWLWLDTTPTPNQVKQYDGTNWVRLYDLGNVVVSQDGSEIYASDSQANDSYVITLSPALTAYVNGFTVRFRANTANTGAATLNVNGLGARTIVKNFNQTLADGDIAAGQIVEVSFDGTNFQLLSPVANVAAIVSAATQAEMEAASSTTTYVSPGRQQFHPSASKFWGRVTYSAGVPTLDVSYNITSISDTAVGRLGVTIANDISSANYCLLGMTRVASGGFRVVHPFDTSALNAGDFVLDIVNASATLSDPSGVWFAGFGDL